MATPAVVIDTDILVDSARGKQLAVDRLVTLEARRPLAIRLVTEMELIVGCRDKCELRHLDGFLDHFARVPMDESIGEKAVGLLRRYRLGHGLLIPDALIAATAMAHALPLWTGNLRDFRFIEGLQLLDD